MPPLLTLKDVSLTFGHQPLLSQVDLTVSASNRICLVGRNGSGKSTLLKIIAGQVEPDQGTRFLQPDTTLRYLPQEPDFSDFQTSLSYVEAGLAPGDDTYRARYLLEQLGLTGEENLSTMSGASRVAAPWRQLWRPRQISSCWMSPPTIWTYLRLNGWRISSEP